MKRNFGGALAVLALAVAPTAAFGAPAEDQGFYKKQGPSGGAGQSECSTAKEPLLPAGQAKKLCR